MLEIAICDDEKKLRLDLRHVIEKELALDGVEFGLTEYESGEALLRGIRERNADIIFLDIEMGGMNGMEAARTLRKNGQPAVIIFVTSYPDFVFHGYEVRALNYILKPYQEKKDKRGSAGCAEGTGNQYGEIFYGGAEVRHPASCAGTGQIFCQRGKKDSGSGGRGENLFLREAVRSGRRAA